MSVTTIYYLSAPEPLIIDLIVTMELDIISIFPLPIQVLEGHCRMNGISLADSSLFFLSFLLWDSVASTPQNLQWFPLPVVISLGLPSGIQFNPSITQRPSSLSRLKPCLLQWSLYPISRKGGRGGGTFKFMLSLVTFRQL